MTGRRLAPAVLASAAALALAGPAAAAPSGYARLITGATAHGTFELSAKRQALGGAPGICLNLEETFADGSSPGGGGGCFAGSIHASGGVAPVATSAASGGVPTSSLVGGIVTKRARRVVVTFADGRTLVMKRPPVVPGWRSALGVKVRFYAGDALARSAAEPVKVRVYDKRGHRIGKRKLG